MFCTSCGNQLKDQQKFCPKCGAKTKFADGAQPARSTQQENEPASVNKDAERAAEELRQQELKRQQEEQERRKREDQRKLKKKRKEEEQHRAELEAKKKAEEDKRREEAEKKRAEEERSRLEKEMNEPLPSDILLELRTILLEKGNLEQQDVSKIKGAALEAGVSAERLRHQLKQELEKFVNRDPKPAPGNTENSEGDKPKKSVGRKVLIPIGIVVLLAVMAACTYVFRISILDQFDGWGFETTSLRETIGIPVVLSNDTVMSNTMGDALSESKEKAVEDTTNEQRVAENELTEPEKTTLKPDAQNQTDNRSPQRETGSTGNKQREPAKTTRYTPPATQEVTLKSADVMPKYPGDNAALQQYISRNLTYPIKARSEGISGVVYVSYVVDERGNITEVNVLKGVHPLLDQAAMDVVRNINGYAPGYQDGKPVRVSKTLPIRFRLD